VELSNLWIDELLGIPTTATRQYDNSTTRISNGEFNIFLVVLWGFKESLNAITNYCFFSPLATSANLRIFCLLSFFILNLKKEGQLQCSQPFAL